MCGGPSRSGFYGAISFLDYSFLSSQTLSSVAISSRKAPNQAVPALSSELWGIFVLFCFVFSLLAIAR